MSNRLNLSVANIVERIYFTLPNIFTRETDSNLYAFLKGIAAIFEVNSEQIDRLFDRTGLSSATGAYLDTMIEDLSNIGRKESESDSDYRDRYFTYIFEYNSSSDGIKLIVYDQLGYYPTLEVGIEHFSFYDATYYWNDLSYSVYSGEEPYVGYIVLTERPTDEQIEELCRLINDNRLSGIKTYLKWPTISNEYDEAIYDESVYE